MHRVLRWRFATAQPVLSSPAVWANTVYVGGSDGNLYALDAHSGHERWRLHTGGPVASSPAVSAGAVYVGSNDGKVYAADALSGRQRWAVTTK